MLYRVMRMRLKTAKRSEFPSTLLELLKRIHQQIVKTSDGQTLIGLTEMTPAQKSLFAALDVTNPLRPRQGYLVVCALMSTSNGIIDLRAGRVELVRPSHHGLRVVARNDTNGVNPFSEPASPWPSKRPSSRVGAACNSSGSSALDGRVAGRLQALAPHGAMNLNVLAKPPAPRPTT